MANEGWELEIRSHLLDLYEDDAEGFAILQTFLDGRDTSGKNPWSTLRILWQRRASTHLRAYTDQIIKNERQRQNICTDLTVSKLDGGNGFTKKVRRLPIEIIKYLYDSDGAKVGIASGLAQTWHTIPIETQTKFVENIAQTCCQRAGVSNCVSVASKCGGTIIAFAVSLCALFVKCGVNVHRWYKGELSGKRCAKMCVDSTVEYSAGFLGAAGGAALGGLVHPLLAIFLAALGGVAGAAAGKKLTEWLTSKIFDLPIDIATENAYRLLELDHHANTKQIDKAYKNLVERYDDVKDEKERRHLVAILNVNLLIVKTDQLNRFGNKLPQTTLQVVNSWYCGDISSKQCAIQCVETNAAPGRLQAVEDVKTGQVEENFSDRLEVIFFDLSKQDAVRNAYNYFKLNQDANLYQIYEAYEEKILENNAEEIQQRRTEVRTIIHIHMAIILVQIENEKAKKS